MTTTKNLGPITTSLALPENCANELETIYKIRTSPEGYYWLQQGPLQQTCYPSGYAALTSQYYSPASCPFGFTPACTSTNELGDLTETVYTCCPTQYDYQCQTTSYYRWEETLGCFNVVTSSLTTTWTVVEISGERTATVRSEGHPGGLNAFSIQVRFQSSDFASSTSTISLSALVLSTGQAAETSSDSSNSNAEQSTGVTVGAAVGITVSVFLALLAIGGAIFICMRRRRRELNPPQGSQPRMHEMGCDTETRFYEAPGAPVFDPRFPTYEIDSRPAAVENSGRY
ncbi:hypothetical protein DL764_002769 [Monosporascus ibericus]|uniref:Uncharacterized protein n=1 Tax=Monosporascus ibericus TaxID=155417 RepID=A0A4Q4TJ47_9PEZI|nr:hypothetical protein DL764_002769 [Monosporascus ibericus]